MDGFYALRLAAIWQSIKQEHFSFWMICCYLFVEYVRPQSIIPALDILPWAKVFLLLSLIGILLDRNRQWTSDPANKWMALFLVAIVLSSLAAAYPSISWDHFMDFFGWFIIYFLIVNVVTSERRFLVFLAIFLLCSFKLSFFGAKTWALRGFSFTSWGLMGPPGFFQNSGEFAIQMLMFSPVAFELALFLRPYISKVKFYFLLLLPITGAMSVMGASSRGAQIALAYQVYGNILKGRLSFKALITVVAVIYVGLALLPEEQKARFSSAGNDGTSQQRLLYWRHGIEMIKDHPIIGVGFYNFGAYFAAHWPQDMLRGGTSAGGGIVVSELPHNIFVQVGTDTGAVGLLVFSMLIYRSWKGTCEIEQLQAKAEDASKPFSAIAKGLRVAMWGFVIAGQFVTVTYYPFFWINLALIVALRNVVLKHYGAVNKIRGANLAGKKGKKLVFLESPAAKAGRQTHRVTL